MEKNRKVDYVRRESRKPAGNHTCHWPGCQVKVQASLWGCRQHWFALPHGLRRRIWLHFRPGQEVDKRPSKAYLLVLEDVENWIRENGE